MNAPQSTDRRADQGRMCVICARTIIPFGAIGYRHQTIPADGHRAEPKMAHSMDTDPFAGLDEE